MSIFIYIILKKLKNIFFIFIIKYYNKTITFVKERINVYKMENMDYETDNESTSDNERVELNIDKVMMFLEETRIQALTVYNKNRSGEKSLKETVEYIKNSVKVYCNVLNKIIHTFNNNNTRLHLEGSLNNLNQCLNTFRERSSSNNIDWLMGNNSFFKTCVDIRQTIARHYDFISP